MPPWERYQQQPAAPSGPWSKYGAQEEAPVSAGGIAKAFAGGVGRGVAGVAGLPSAIGSGMDYLIDRGAEALGMEAKGPRPEMSMFPTAQGAQGAIEKVTGPLPTPQNTAEEYAATAGEFLPGMAFGGPRQIMSNVIAPAVTSETAGQMTKGTAAEPYARAAGAIGGAFIPGAARRAVTPLPVGAERNAAVQNLRGEGVNSLTPGQTTGRNALRYFESEKGGRAGAQMMEAQAEEFTAAALRRVGTNARRATPEVIDESFTRIGGQFDALAARNNLNFDARLGRELVDVYNDYTALVPPSSQAPIVRQTLQDLTNASNALRAQGTQSFSGESYQALRSRLDKAARASRISDPQLAEAMRGIRDALDNGMERSIRATNPRDVGAWRNARREYRNMLVIEDAATAAGENARLGLISPSALRAATKKQSKRGFARGQGDFAELARSGEAIMKPLPQSGTAPRLAAQGLMTGLGALAGGGTTGTAEGGALGALAGLAGPRVLARLAMSGPGRAYLGNQAMTNPGRVPLSQLVPLEATLGSRRLRE